VSKTVVEAMEMRTKSMKAPSYYERYEAEPPRQDPNDTANAMLPSQSSNRTAHQHSIRSTLNNLFPFAKSNGYLICGCLSMKTARSFLDRKQ